MTKAARTSLRCILIQPPLCDPSCPPLGLAYLSSVLISAGIDHFIEDLNLDFIEYLSGTTQSDVTSIYDSSSNYLTEAIKRRVIFETVNAFARPFFYEPYSITLPGATGDLVAMQTAASNSNGHFFRWLCKSKAVSRMAALKPDWIGISVSYLGQLPATFAIAHFCQHQLQTKVVLGGGLFNDFSEHLDLTAQPWRDVNGIILGAGESLVAQFIRLLNGTIAPPLHRVDYPGNRWCAKSPVRTLPPFPDFSHFPLDRYRAPGLVLPFRAFSACTWGKCAFCSDSKYHFHSDTASGDVGSIISQVLLLRETYEAKGIYFLDAELPVPFMAKFAMTINKSVDDPPRWGGNARFSAYLAEPATAKMLYSSGCRLLRLGLESGSPRILQQMIKGVTPHLASQVLSALYEAGIVTHVYLMKGFPGETESDWKATIAFLNSNAANIDMFNISSFQLHVGSALAKDSNSIIETSADENHWTYPYIRGYSQDLTEDTQLFRKIERDFFTSKPFTRCFCCTADTLLLSERFQIEFS